MSQPSGNTLFAGFGVRVLNSVDWQPSRFVLLHSKAVRDIQFHPDDRDMMLSVSLDQNAKLFDLGTNTTVHTFKGTILEYPLFLCWKCFVFKSVGNVYLQHLFTNVSHLIAVNQIFYLCINEVSQIDTQSMLM